MQKLSSYMNLVNTQNMEDVCGIFFVIHISSDHLLSDHYALDPPPSSTPMSTATASTQLSSTPITSTHPLSTTVTTHLTYPRHQHIQIPSSQYPHKQSVHLKQTCYMRLSTVFLFHFMRARSRIVLSSPELTTETAAG